MAISGPALKSSGRCAFPCLAGMSQFDFRTGSEIVRALWLSLLGRLVTLSVLVGFEERRGDFRTGSGIEAGALVGALEPISEQARWLPLLGWHVASSGLVGFAERRRDFKSGSEIEAGTLLRGYRLGLGSARLSVQSAPIRKLCLKSVQCIVVFMRVRMHACM